MKAILPFALALFAAAAQAAPVTYELDPDHTYPSFEADHMGLSVWRGKFNKSSGKVVLDKTAGAGTVEVAIDIASVDFGLDALNTWAVGPEFFNAAKNPKAFYKGKLTDWQNGAPTKVTGELTLNGITQPVNLKINSFKCVPHPLFKRDFCGADVYTEFERDRFGLDAGKDYGFKMQVVLRIQVEGLAQAAP